jgi:TRAP-type transport system periplasmic protein
MRRLNLVIAIFLTISILCGGAPVFISPAAAQTRVLKAISYVPMSKTDPSMVLMQMFMDKVNERARGAVRIDFLGATEVIPANDQMGALTKGIIDFLNTPTYHKDAVCEVRASELSEISPAEERANGFFDLIVEAHKKKLKTIPLMRLVQNAPFYIFTNVKVQKLQDFKGLKFRSNVSYDEFFQRLGIVRVAMPATEVYTAMERNMISGYALPKYITRYALQETTKYRVDHPWWFGGSQYLYINQKTFESLPADIQKIINTTALEVEKQIPAVQYPLDEAEDKAQLAAKMQFIKLTPPDDKKLVETAHQVIWDIIFKEIPDVAPKLKKLTTKNP